MESEQLSRCQHLISERMGFKLREQDAALVSKTLQQRIQVLRVGSMRAYYELLRSNSPAAEKEWKQLFILLTNQESYFFRDQGQFDLLREIIIPRLLEENREQRTLRLWSAGCSTGEEPYSLAILLDQLLPFRHDWQIHILGTDLSDAALEKARRGLYGAWSFRIMSPETASKYFEPRQGNFELLPRIREMVTFRHGNLLDDHFPTPSGGTNDLDLIVCRNVFIYFKRDAVARVIDKFTNCIRINGYLLTGHAELHDTPLGHLKIRSYPRTVIYQRVANGAAVPPTLTPHSKPSAPASARPASRVAPLPAKTTSVAVSQPISPASTSTADSTPIEKALASLRHGDSSGALRLLDGWVSEDKQNFAALCIAGQAFANLGRYEEAAHLCLRAEKLNTFAALPLLIRARIAEEMGHSEAAKSLLKKVVYLEPHWVTPYLELSTLYAHEGDSGRATTMRAAALEAVAELADSDFAPADPLSGEERHNVGALRRFLTRS